MLSIQNTSSTYNILVALPAILLLLAQTLASEPTQATPETNLYLTTTFSFSSISSMTSQEQEDRLLHTNYTGGNGLFHEFSNGLKTFIYADDEASTNGVKVFGVDGKLIGSQSKVNETLRWIEAIDGDRVLIGISNSVQPVLRIQSAKDTVPVVFSQDTSIDATGVMGISTGYIDLNSNYIIYCSDYSNDVKYIFRADISNRPAITMQSNFTYNSTIGDRFQFRKIYPFPGDRLIIISSSSTMLNLPITNMSTGVLVYQFNGFGGSWLDPSSPDHMYVANLYNGFEDFNVTRSSELWPPTRNRPPFSIATQTVKISQLLGFSTVRLLAGIYGGYGGTSIYMVFVDIDKWKQLGNALTEITGIQKSAGIVPAAPVSLAGAGLVGTDTYRIAFMNSFTHSSGSIRHALTLVDAKIGDCSERNENGVCTKCGDGYSISGTTSSNTCVFSEMIPKGNGVDPSTNTIVACQDPKCVQCKSDYKKCTVCDTASGYFLDATTSKCVIKTSIPNYQGVDSSSGTIMPCQIDNCAACTDNYKVCKRCVDGRKLHVSGFCYRSEGISIINTGYQSSNSMAYVFFNQEISKQSASTTSHLKFSSTSSSTESQVIVPNIQNSLSLMNIVLYKEGQVCKDCIRQTSLSETTVSSPKTLAFIVAFNQPVYKGTLHLFNIKATQPSVFSSDLKSIVESNDILIDDVYSRTDQAFTRFMVFSDWLAAICKSAHMFWFRLLAGAFAGPSALLFHEMISSLAYLKMLTGVFQLYPSHFLRSFVQYGSYFPFFRQNLGGDNFECNLSVNLRLEEFYCGLFQNYGANMIILLVLLVVCSGISIATRIVMNKKNLDYEQSTTGLLKWANMAYGLPLFFDFLEGAMLELLIYSILNIWYMHNASHMIVGIIFSFIALLLLIGKTYLLFSLTHSTYDLTKAAQELDQPTASTTLSAVIEHSNTFPRYLHRHFANYRFSTDRAPLYVFQAVLASGKKVVQGFFIVALSGAPQGQLIFLLVIEMFFLLLMIAFRARASLLITILELLQHSFPALFIIVKLISTTDMTEQNRQEGWGFFLAILLIIYVMANLIGFVFFSVMSVRDTFFPIREKKVPGNQDREILVSHPQETQKLVPDGASNNSKKPPVISIQTPVTIVRSNLGSPGQSAKRQIERVPNTEDDKIENPSKFLNSERMNLTENTINDLKKDQPIKMTAKTLSLQVNNQQGLEDREKENFEEMDDFDDPAEFTPSSKPKSNFASNRFVKFPN